MRIGLIFGGRSVEHEVSITSARTVARGLVAAGHTVVPLPIGADGVWADPALGTAALEGAVDRLPAGGGAIPPSLAPLLEARIDAAFPIVHGTWGEDGTLQGFSRSWTSPTSAPGWRRAPWP
jgi:D-alanine-D-alanine ligase